MALLDGDLVLVSYKSLWEGQVIRLNLWYQVQDIMTPVFEPEGLESIADAFADPAEQDVLNAYAACLGSNVVVTQVTAQRIWPTRSIYMGANVQPPTSTPLGTSEQGALTAALNIRSEHVGPDGYSVKKIGPLPDAGLEGGAFTDPLKTSLDLLGVAMLADVSIVDVTGSFTLKPRVVTSEGVDFAAIDWQVSDRQGTMRRRILRVGE